LYKVLLDLDSDQQFGDMNNGDLQVLNPASGKIKGGDVSLTIVFPVWDNPAVTDLLLTIDPASVSGAVASFTTGNNITIQIDFNYTSEGSDIPAVVTGIVDVDLQSPRQACARE
jgi:hypothetical protein